MKTLILALLLVYLGVTIAHTGINMLTRNITFEAGDRTRLRALLAESLTWPVELVDVGRQLYAKLRKK